MKFKNLSKEITMTTLQRMLDDMKLRNLAPTTQASYVQHVSMFTRHFDKSPETIVPEEIRSYQLYLSIEKKSAPIDSRDCGLGPSLPLQRS
jgi:integrase/recombinase XerD